MQLELCAPEIYEMFVYKHLEKIDMLESNLLIKKNTNSTG